MTSLIWHNYKYFPYEKDLAAREIFALLGAGAVELTNIGATAQSCATPSNASRLVYFSSFEDSRTGEHLPTRQALLERVSGNGRNRQSTRYSAHGLHEYKGKFNPQVAKALLNIFGVKEGQWVLDPFCGSGTSLVEASHLGVNGVGTDINPLAVYLANAKVLALSVAAKDIERASKQALASIGKMRKRAVRKDARREYLESWFPAENLNDIEALRLALQEQDCEKSGILLAVASNLLRDYSLQEPGDLRIRRRISPFPGQTYLAAYDEAVASFVQKLSASQDVLGLVKPVTKACLMDSRQSLERTKEIATAGFDAALTSPPYATALPYIDTQRLSLVWLGLLEPSEILALEARLVGSREIRGTGKAELLSSLEANKADLPAEEAALCVRLQQTLTEQDGFRRQAVPRLLYRYFADMAESFASVRRVMKAGARYGLIVGGNHTVLGGRRFDINTPNHLASLAVSRGWRHLETVELQTYKRYGLHSKNASTTEALVILQA
ncbi:TRM11 family methyltransferase [Rubrivivax sp. JA1055]|uniref:TRM11 family SAM-dependent methyltransferase n=1 Tax=Rubrivivax sp. JA1055 TaxID=2894194 RepID=UPI001E574E14|nr:DNA methyltransferase [Rubrivivax sp. JA1055]MCC9596428.1 hypothetical protein [Rubrivivax sp. JA1055]